MNDWRTCELHGPAIEGAWGCPDCVRELRRSSAKLKARIEEADRIILTLTEDHNNTPNYVRGFDMAQEYFAKYHDEESGK